MIWGRGYFWDTVPKNTLTVESCEMMSQRCYGGSLSSKGWDYGLGHLKFFFGGFRFLLQCTA